MVNQYLWIAIAVGVFFVGFGISYGIFANAYDPFSMKFQNQQMFDQMMSNNPKMSAQWMESMGGKQMDQQGMMGQKAMSGSDHIMNATSMKAHQSMHDQMMAGISDPVMRQQMVDEMNRHHQTMLDMLEHAVDDPQLKKQLREKIQKHMSDPMMQMQQIPTAIISPVSEEFALSSDELYEKMQREEFLFIIDIREEDKYKDGHIEGSAIGACDERSKEKILPKMPTSISIVLVDEDGSKSTEALSMMQEFGLDVYYLEGGIQNWDKELVQSDSDQKITSAELWVKMQTNQDIFLLDVREPEEVAETSISTSVNIPLASLYESDGLSKIPKDKPVVIICASGNRAVIASFALAAENYDYQILEGGMKSWNAFLEENNLPET